MPRIPGNAPRPADVSHGDVRGEVADPPSAADRDRPSPGGERVNRSRQLDRTELMQESTGTDHAWMRTASCRGRPPGEFFPSDGVGVERAKKLCVQCPVRLECLEYALELPDRPRRVGRVLRARAAPHPAPPAPHPRRHHRLTPAREPVGRPAARGRSGDAQELGHAVHGVVHAVVVRHELLAHRRARRGAGHDGLGARPDRGDRRGGLARGRRGVVDPGAGDAGRRRAGRRRPPTPTASGPPPGARADGRSPAPCRPPGRRRGSTRRPAPTRTRPGRRSTAAPARPPGPGRPRRAPAGRRRARAGGARPGAARRVELAVEVGGQQLGDAALAGTGPDAVVEGPLVHEGAPLRAVRRSRRPRWIRDRTVPTGTPTARAISS